MTRKDRKALRRVLLAAVREAIRAQAALYDACDAGGLDREAIRECRRLEREIAKKVRP